MTIKEKEQEILALEDQHFSYTQYQLFEDQDLSGKDFSNQDLSGTNFTNCNLDGAILVGSTLEYVSLNGCSMNNIVVDATTRIYGCPHTDDLIDPAILAIVQKTESPYRNIIREKNSVLSEQKFGINTRTLLLEGIEIVAKFRVIDLSPESQASLKNWIDAGDYTEIVGDSPRVKDKGDIYQHISLEPEALLKDVLNAYMQSTDIYFDSETEQFMSYS